MVEKKWLKSRVQLLLCVSYYFRMVSFCETLDFYEIILSNHASDPWSVRYLPTSLKIRYIPAEILFVTMHFSLLASRTFQRELAWIAFSLGKEAKVAVLFHLGFHGCEYGWCLVALRVCNQPQNFCLFPKAIQDVCDRAPSWTLAVYSLTSLSSLPNSWSGSLRMCLPGLSFGSIIHFWSKSLIIPTYCALYPIMDLFWEARFVPDEMKVESALQEHTSCIASQRAPWKTPGNERMGLKVTAILEMAMFRGGWVFFRAVLSPYTSWVLKSNTQVFNDQKK